MTVIKLLCCRELSLVVRKVKLVQYVLRIKPPKLVVASHYKTNMDNKQQLKVSVPNPYVEHRSHGRICGRIWNEDVDAAELLHRLVDQLLAVLGAADVARKTDDHTKIRLQSGGSKRKVQTRKALMKKVQTRKVLTREVLNIKNRYFH